MNTDHIESIYENITETLKEKGFPPSGRQVADKLKLDYDKIVRPAINDLCENGRIVKDKIKLKADEFLD